MKKHEILAKKLLEFTKELPKWNFQLTENGGNYYVEALINNYTKGKIFTTFELKEKYVLLKVWSPDGKYNDGFVYENLKELSDDNEIMSKYGIYSTVFGKKAGICLNSPMPLEVLEKEMSTVIWRLMLGMIATLLIIICYGN